VSLTIKLNGDVFRDLFPVVEPGRKLRGIDASGNHQWCVDRCERFQRMTQGKGKPMVYGSMKKGK